MELDLDLGGKTVEEAEAGGFIDQPGWYRTVIENVQVNERGDSVEWLFRGTMKPVKGMTCRAYLTLPDWATGEDGGETAKKRLVGWFGRFGIVDGAAAQGKARYNLAAAIGREAVIELKTRSWTDQKTGKEKTKTDITFMGAYPLDHPRIPDDVRKRLQLPPARVEDDAPGTAGGTPTTRPAARQTRDYSDL